MNTTVRMSSCKPEHNKPHFTCGSPPSIFCLFPCALCLAFLALCLMPQSASADYHWSDSPSFHLDLLTVQPGGGYDFADSGIFTATLYPVQRGFADSADFRICLKYGDLDVDCCVSLADMDTFVGHWLETGCAGPNWCSWADFEKSGSVDFVDFALLAGNWLIDCDLTAGNAAGIPK